MCPQDISSHQLRLSREPEKGLAYSASAEDSGLFTDPPRTGSPGSANKDPGPVGDTRTLQNGGRLPAIPVELGALRFPWQPSGKLTQLFFPPVTMPSWSGDQDI